MNYKTRDELMLEIRGMTYIKKVDMKENEGILIKNVKNVRQEIKDIEVPKKTIYIY